jgi:two-component sensor histidine kinase
VVVVSAIGLLAGFAVAAGFGAVVLESARNRAQEELVAAAAAGADRLRGQFATVEQTLRIVVAQDDVATDLEDCPARLAALTAPIAELVSGMIMADASGRIVCAVPESAIGRSIADTDSFRALRRGDSVVITPITVGTFTAEELVGVSVPRVLAEGVGAVASGVRVSALAVRARGAVPGVSLWLADVRGRVIGLQDDPNAMPPPPDILGGVANGGAMREQVVRDRRVLAVAERLAPSLAVVATRPAHAVEAEALDLALGALLAALVTLAVAVGAIALLLRRAVLRPLHLLAEGLGNGATSSGGTARLGIPQELDAIWDRVADYQRQVQDREARLTDLLAARTHLVHEVHHRTKNNLQIVSSLLSLQEGRNPDARVAGQLRIARERVAVLAALHQLLYAGSGGDRVEVGQFLRDLLRGIARAAGVEGRGILMRVTADRVHLHMDQAGPVGLVVNELVTNSLKYAFRDRPGGTITVTATRLGDELEVVVADDGPGDGGSGLPQGGLGSLLVAGFARQLRGRLQRRPVPGMVVALTFPLPDEPAAEPTVAATAA